MASSENLVPKGLPHGQRQNVEAGMEAAGLPKGTTQRQAPTSPTAGRRSAPPRSTNSAAPTDPLMTLDAQQFRPAEQAMTFEQRIEAIGQQTANPLLALAARRIVSKR